MAKRRYIGQEDMKPLCAFVSKDETRYHLCGIYFDESGYAVSTDGHRLFGTKRVITGDKGKIAKIGPYERDQDMVYIDGKYPNWKQFTPVKHNFAMTLEIPEWFSIFEKVKKAAPVYFSYNFGEPSVTLTAPKDKDHFCINAKLIAPLAGRLVCLQWKEELSPILVTESHGAWNKGDWFAVIMPMRGGDGIHTSVPKQVIEDLNGPQPASI